MVDKSRFSSSDSTDTENTSNDSGTSTTHLYFVEDGDPSERGAGLNHDAEAYDLFNEGSEGYRSFTQRGDGRRMTWTVSDTLSHIAVAYEPLFDKFGSDPEAYTRVAQATCNALATSLDGNTAEALGLFEPDEEDLVDYAIQSDDVEIQDILDEVRSRTSDSDSDE